MYGVLIGFLLLYIFIESMYRIEHDTFIITRYQLKNMLFQCKQCKKLYREYQKKMYMDINKDSLERYETYCPHCNCYRTGYGGEIGEKLKVQPKWTDGHPDCPKINFIQHLKVKKTTRQIIKNQKLQYEQRFFEDYNKIKVDFGWIENLKKHQ